jgi:CRISPR-associated protein Cmr4
MDMFFGEKLYWLHAVSPLHLGAGRGVGYIDLPIAREKGTSWPYIPGSAVKGVIADRNGAAEDNRKEDTETGKLLAAAFGRRAENKNLEPADATAGSLVFSDAAVVCMPVRSFYGTFAWITSPFALERLRCPDKPETPDVAGVNHILTVEGDKISQNSKVYLEDLDLEAQNDARLGAWGRLLAESVFPGRKEWQEIFKARFSLVHDDVFTFFCETGTQIDARIRLDESTKTTVKGALWYEESLPTDTILAGVVWCDKVYGSQFTPKDLLEKFCQPYVNLQIGGKASIGRGQVRCVFSGGGQ